MLTKIANGLILLGLACIPFLVLLFAGMGVPEWVVVLYGIAFWFWWLPILIGIIIHIVLYFKNRGISE
jgi:hypothetical protein